MELFHELLYWIYAALLSAAAVVDIRTRKIAPSLVYTMFGLGVLKIIIEIMMNQMYLASLWAALLTFAITFLTFWGIYLVSHGIGFGDVKLMAAAGLFYSIQGIFTIVIFSMLLTAGAGVCMVIKNRKNFKAELPFAPFVAAAAVLREIFRLADRFG